MKIDLRSFVGKSLADEAHSRREWLESTTHTSLSSVGQGQISSSWQSRNIENLIGTTQVPLGVAGPVKYQITNNQLPTPEEQSLYLPLATTEGALVASVSRGCKTISESGGASVVVEDLGMSRAPAFRIKNIKEGLKIRDWLRDHQPELEEKTRNLNQYLELKTIQTYIVGRNLYIRFSFLTGQAMGMNMVTIATQELVNLIESKFRVKCISLSGNLCTDKKSAAINRLLGRGKRVWAEVVIPQKVVKSVLKTNPQSIVDVWTSKTLLGSAVAGSTGFNAQAANIVAAMFLATGQDLGHVVHGSEAITTMELDSTGLYASVYLPDLPAGTVGGGTSGSTQKEALSLLGLADTKPDDASRLAAAIAVGVLAGELSLHAALSTNDLARAHHRLGQAGKK